MKIDLKEARIAHASEKLADEILKGDKIMLRGNGVTDSILACCAGGSGSIPAGGNSNVHYSGGFFSISE